MRPVRKVVIPVAGLGTRMLPATKVLPKEMVPIAGKPAIQWIVEDAAASGVEQVILVTSAGKSAIEDHFDASPILEQWLAARGKHDLLATVRATRQLARVIAVRQPEPLGLGHAILMAKEAVGNERFAVLLADDMLHADTPALKQCLDVDADCVLGLARVPREHAPRYGMVSVASTIDERTFLLDGMVEKPQPEDSPSDLAITGNPYILVPEIFSILERTPPGQNGEIQLTDALKVLATRARFAGRLVQGERLDIGNPLGFLQANVVKGLADASVGAAFAAWLKDRAR